MIEVWFKKEGKWIKTEEYKTVYHAFEYLKRMFRLFPHLDIQNFELRERTS